MIILLFYLSIIKISDSPKNIYENIRIIYNHKEKQEEDVIGSLKIESLNINEKLYKIESPENNVDKHVTILKESIFPDKENSIIFIAAHSGTGDIAYFKNLDKINKNDLVTLNINDEIYNYIVKDIWEDPKNGYININKDKENQLILTTCSPNNSKKQLIVNCIEKESN